MYKDFADFVHQNLLKPLDYVHNVCKKENIDYSLYAGTMIGAVRHKGFVPWDDDVDICMTRENFEKFKSVVGKYQDEDVFFTHCGDRVPEVNFKKPLEFEGKKYGAFGLDFYIADKLPNNERKRKKLVFKLKKIQGMMKKGKVKWHLYNFKGKVLVFCTKLMGMFSSMKSLAIKYEKVSKKYLNEEANFRFLSNDNYSIFDMPYDKKHFERYVECPFEDRTYKMFADYDVFLRGQYGDYMQLPPEEKRVFIHAVAQ